MPVPVPSEAFRLERPPGGACTHWKRRLVTAHTLTRHSDLDRAHPLDVEAIWANHAPNASIVAIDNAEAIGGFTDVRRLPTQPAQPAPWLSPEIPVSTRSLRAPIQERRGFGVATGRAVELGERYRRAQLETAPPAPEFNFSFVCSAHRFC